MKHVVLDREFTYAISPSQSRTFPAGWCGPVEDDVAKAITKEKAGRVEGARRKPSGRDVDPGATDPGATDPAAADPNATDPGATDPGATDPDATDSGTGGGE